MTLPRLCVFISGSGTNLQALLDAIQAGTLDAQPVGVISDKSDAYGLIRAQKADVPSVTFPYKPFRGRGREAYDTALADVVAGFRPDLIMLAGFMRILTPAFLDRFPGRILNLHPALPGMFPGIRAIERAFEAYQNGEITHSGVMVHEVIPELDAGPVIATSEVAIYPDDTLQDYAERLHAAEHKLIVSAVAKKLGELRR